MLKVGNGWDEYLSAEYEKDYFINLKIPREERDSILLLANGNEIVWIIGYRLNWNYRVTSELQNIYKLEAKMKKRIYKED